MFNLINDIDMNLRLLKSKLHKAWVTHAELEYEGSCAIDGDLLDAANMREYEQIDIYNIANGERFTTYIIRAESGSGIISVNGAAAHKAQPGDKIIICTYADYSPLEADKHKPALVYLDRDNKIARTANIIPTQAA